MQDWPQVIVMLLHTDNIVFCFIFPARPGKVVGPIMPKESGSMKDAYDPRRFARNPVLPVEPAIPPYCFHSTTGRSENSNRDPIDAERERGPIQHRPSQPGMTSKLTPDIALDTRAAPFYLAGPKADSAERNTMEANVLQAKSPFNGIVTAAGGGGGHRKVGTLQFGMARMY